MSGKAWLELVTLSGRVATLEPLSYRRHDELARAVEDGALWNLWYTSVPPPERMAAEIDGRLNLQCGGNMLPFAVIENASARAVGMTTYMNVDGVLQSHQIAPNGSLRDTCATASSPRKGRR